MATVRMYRGHWVADYYDANQRRRIERPEGYFEKAREELQAAQVLLADRVAEVADDWYTRAAERSRMRPPDGSRARSEFDPRRAAATSTSLSAISSPISVSASSA